MDATERSDHRSLKAYHERFLIKEDTTRNATSSPPKSTAGVTM